MKAYGPLSSSRRSFHIAARTVFRVASDNGWCRPLVRFVTGAGKDGRGLPKVGETAVEAVHPEDVQALLYESDDGVHERHVAARKAARLAFALGAYAGLRASEIRALRWRDVDLRRGEITVREAMCGGETDKPKSGHERVIPIAPALAALLDIAKQERKPEPEDYAAPKADGNPWGDYGIREALVRATKRLGLSHARVHALRHHFATQLFEDGTNARVAQDLLGHHSLEVTQRYADTSLKAKQKAVSIFRAPLAVIEGGKSKRATG